MKVVNTSFFVRELGELVEVFISKEEEKEK